MRRNRHPQKSNIEINPKNSVSNEVSELRNIELKRLSNDITWETKEVSSGRYYNIFGFLHNKVSENINASLVIIDFGIELNETDFDKNGLQKSEVGYYKYLPSQQGVCLWEIEIFIPLNISTIRIGFKTWKNKNEIIVSTSVGIRRSLSASFLQEENIFLLNKITQMQSELMIAQQKRSGHYAKLEYEQKRVKKLLKQIEFLEKDNLRMRNSLSLAVGTAIVQTKSIKDALKLPLKIREALKNHKHKLSLKAKTVQNMSQCTEISNDTISVPLYNHPVKTIQHNTDLNVLGWPFPPNNGKINMLSIFDEFSRDCFAPLANLIEPRPDNCIPLLHRDKPQLLFVESTWRGNKSTWQYRVAKYANPPGQELFSLVSECKKNNIPTVFWNKEDPVHFANFIHAAKEFDYIFTTAEEAVIKYKEHCNANVYALPFAAESGLHNPIGSVNRNEKVCFAGSYYANRFIERRDDQLMLLNAASNFDLDIYDRNAGTGISRDFQFPERFDPFIRGKLPYVEMNRAYRKYKVFLNVNSVIDSKTMFSRRVFELLACGTPIVSTISTGIEEMFGNDLVWMVKTEEEANEAIKTLLSSPIEWRRRSLQGIRAVFSKHTFAHRLEEVLRITNIQQNFIPKKNVLLIARAINKSEIDRLIYIHSKLRLNNVLTRLLIFSKVEATVPNDHNVLIHNSEHMTMNVILQEINSFQITHIGNLNPKSIYGAYYLQDILHAFDYSTAKIVAKPKDMKDTYEYGLENMDNSFVFKVSCLELLKEDFFDEKIFSKSIQSENIETFIPDAANYKQSDTFLSISQYNNNVKKIEI